MSLKVGDIMIKEVKTIEAKATVKEAVNIMNENNIGCVVVTQDEIPMGIITERDMLIRVLLEARDPSETKVSQIMTAPLVLGSEEMLIQDAVRLMIEKEIKKLPVIEDGRLVGLITLTDLVRSIAYLEHIFTKTHKNVLNNNAASRD